MTTENLNNDFMEQVIEDLAWKEISSNQPWSEQLLDKYKDKVHWGEISGNSEVVWTSSMLDKYKSRIDWDELSESRSKNLFSIEILEKYKSYWNWSNLSSNRWIKFDKDMLNRFADKWNWKELISNRELDAMFSAEFLKEFYHYIPASALQSSSLWDKLVEDKSEELISKIRMS